MACRGEAVDAGQGGVLTHLLDVAGDADMGVSVAFIKHVGGDPPRRRVAMTAGFGLRSMATAASGSGGFDMRSLRSERWWGLQPGMLPGPLRRRPAAPIRHRSAAACALIREHARRPAGRTATPGQRHGQGPRTGDRERERDSDDGRGQCPRLTVTAARRDCAVDRAGLPMPGRPEHASYGERTKGWLPV